MLSEARSKPTTSFAIQFLVNARLVEGFFISITRLPASILLVSLSGVSFFCLPLTQPPIAELLGPKIKIPPPGFFRRWDSRIARYDSRVVSTRRQKTHTYSRYNRGNPAWASGRRTSPFKGTEKRR